MARISRGVLPVFIVSLLIAAALATPVESYKRTGDNAYDQLGNSVRGAGDVNGDGVPDFIVGAANADFARVYSGADGSLLHTLTGANPGDGFGQSVSGAGDVDGDGSADLIVGGPWSDYAIVFSGADGSAIHTVYGINGAELFGSSVEGVGDVDGDGYDDFVVGAPDGYDADWNQCGYAVVFSGLDAGTLFTFYGVGNGDKFGNAVAGAGDVDGDGTGDVIVGAPGAADTGGAYPGAAYVFSGASGEGIHTVYGEDDGGNFGYAVDGAGDFDGDGQGDVVVGAPLSSSGTGFGAVRVFSGQDASVLLKVDAEKGEDALGESVSGAGDLNGDGYDDVLAGAPDMYDSAGTSQTGAVRAWSGTDGSVLFTIEGANDQDRFGASVAWAGDVNADGWADFVVGAPANSDTAATAGAAYLYVSPAPSGTIEIASGAAATSSSKVTLGLTWEAGEAKVAEMRLRNAGESWGSWTSPQASVSWDLATGEGTRTVEAQFRDEIGLVSAVVSDSIVVDATDPTCGISIAAGAAFTNSPDVNLTITWSDAGSGVARVRLRNAGEVWGAWAAPSSPVAFRLTAGEGTRTVEAQAEDTAGNLSTVASDAIGVDLTAPTGTVVIADGASFTATAAVSLTLSASDLGGSGLSEMRFRGTGTPAFGDWAPFASSHSFVFASGSGTKAVEAQFRDGAGNVSSSVTDSILLDQTAPTIDELELNPGTRYVLPLEALAIRILAHDNDPGTGLSGFRWSGDGGTTWSAWTAFTSGQAVEVERPPAEGPFSVRVAVRDFAGNESVVGVSPGKHLLEQNPAWLGCSGGFAGAMSDRGDIDVISFDLVKGDLLSVKMKVRGADRTAPFPLVFDLARAEGERLLEGVTAIAAYAAPETGRYVLVLRQEGTEGSEQGTYALAVKVKHARANAAWKGPVAGDEILLEAAEGSTLKAALAGAGLDPASVEISGPGGVVAITVSGKPGSAKLAGVLDQGSGVYRIRFLATGPVTGSWSTKLPKGRALLEP